MRYAYLITLGWNQLIEFFVSQWSISVEKIFLPVRHWSWLLTSRSSWSWRHHRIVTLHRCLHEPLSNRCLSRFLVPSSGSSSSWSCSKSALSWVRSFRHHSHRSWLRPSSRCRSLTSKCILSLTKPGRCHTATCCCLPARCQIPSIPSRSSFHSRSSSWSIPFCR